MRLSRTSSRKKRGESLDACLRALRDRRVSTCVTVIALVGSTATFAQAQVTLQYRWEQGQAITYQTTLKTDSTATIPGADDVTVHQAMTQRIKLLAAAVAPDGTATLQQTVEAVKVDMTTPLGTISFDSAAPKRDDTDDVSRALANVFGGMVGTTISVTMAPDGAIQRIDGADRALDKIAHDLPQDRPSQQMLQSLKSVLSEDSLRASLSQSFPRLPPQPVRPGDNWTAPQALGGPAGKIAGTQTLTLTSIDGTHATIGVALVLTQQSASPLGPSGAIVKLGDIRGTGEILFDISQGRIVKATMNTELPSTMTTSTPEGHTVTIKNLSKTSMTMEETK
jgi:hypothetical protein